MKRVFFVTGGIASGKSSFMKMASERGFACISADKVAHQILEQNGRELAKYLGISSFLQDGAVNREKLGELVFSDKSLRKKLENFMHPKIYAIITDRLYTGSPHPSKPGQPRLGKRLHERHKERS